MRFSFRTLTITAAAAALLTIVPGCDRRTPEERLQTAYEFYQQGDTLSAEMEALKVVEKAPDDPAATQASMMLAQIYAQQQDFEGAEDQMERVLENVSQLEAEGKDALRMYLSLLSNQGKFDEALKVVDEYQQEYAEDPGTSLSLTVAVADIKTQAGQTTEARTVLSDLIDRTTHTQERAIYRDMYLRTYMAEGDTTSAIEYVEGGMDQFTEEEKQAAYVGLASLYAATGNYEKSRENLQQLTDDMMSDIRQEVDRRAKMGMALQLGDTYAQLGNLPGAQRVFQTIYDTNPSDPQLAGAAVNGLSQVLLRLGETSATAELLTDAAAKHPQAPFKEQLQRLEEFVASGQLETMSPMDTSTLTMKYREDSNILWPSDLPGLIGGQDATTGTATGAPQTTGTAAMTAGASGTTTGSAEVTAIEGVSTQTEPIINDTPQTTPGAPGVLALPPMDEPTPTPEPDPEPTPEATSESAPETDEAEEVTTGV